MVKKLLFLVLIAFSALGISQNEGKNIGIVGPAANGWPDANNPTPDIALTDNGDGTYSLLNQTLTTGPAKFREDQDWATSYGGNTFPSGPVTGDDIPVVAGVYDILLDLNTNTFSFTDVSTFTEIEIVGTGVLGTTNPQMATTDGENYSLVTTQFQTGDLEFQEVGTTTRYGNNTFPTGTATQGGAAIPATAGYYMVNFNLTSGDYSFTTPSVGIVGPGAAGWPDNGPTDIAMTTTDGDTYTLDDQVLTTGEVKFRQNQDWAVNWGGTAFPAGAAEPNSGNNIPAIAGTYDITFSRSTLTYTFTVVTASIDGDSFSEFKVYPNPSSNVWVFENATQSIKSITLYDTVGKVVSQIQPNSLTGSIDAQLLTGGLYLAQVSLVDGSQTTVKLFKK